MIVEFYKYQGTGNDFVLIDNRSYQFNKPNVDIVKMLCDRHFGIGSDGLMLLESATGYDFKMVYYNSDGNESSMCGNGGRCIVAFANKLGIIKNKTEFLAIDGTHKAEILSDEPNPVVSLKMIDVQNIEIGEDYFYLNTGSPHYVKFVDNVHAIDLINEARKIRYSDRFKTVGTNVNFVDTSDDIVNVRTYERGVEDETLSCGTGVTAVALAVSLRKNTSLFDVCDIVTQGGNVRVKLKRVKSGFENIWLEGPATFVFKGTVNV